MENNVNPIEKLLEDEKTLSESLRDLQSNFEVRIGAFQQSLSVLNGTATPEIERAINDRIRKEQDTLQKIKIQLRASESKASAFREALKAVANPSAGVTRDIRPTSELAKIREVLREAGKCLTLNEILTARGKANEKKLYRSLRGTLAQYAKNKRVFTKDEATGAFGLIEFKDQKEEGLPL